MVGEIHVAADKASESGALRASRADTASYIADMSTELAALAGACSLPMLAYFLNLARVEAQICARDQGERGPAAEPSTRG